MGLETHVHTKLSSVISMALEIKPLLVTSGMTSKWNIPLDMLWTQQRMFVHEYQTLKEDLGTHPSHDTVP